MRTFPRRGWDRTPPDIVIEPDGQVWVSIMKTNMFYNEYEKIEDLRAEDYGSARSSGFNSSERPGTRGGRASNGYTGRSSGDDEGYKFDREPDPVADTMFIHEWIEKWFAKQSRDDFPISGGA